MTDQESKPGIIIEDGKHAMSAEELTRFVNDAEFDVNKLNDDGSQHATLADYYYNALYQFGSMLSMRIPEQFKGTDERDTETKSTTSGIEAVDYCLKKLRGEKMIALSSSAPGEFDTLGDWYSEAFINYMDVISSKVPEKFDAGEDSAKKSNLAAIKAFVKLRRELVGSIQ